MITQLVIGPCLDAESLRVKTFLVLFAPRLEPSLRCFSCHPTVNCTMRPVISQSWRPSNARTNTRNTFRSLSYSSPIHGPLLRREEPIHRNSSAVDEVHSSRAQVYGAKEKARLVFYVIFSPCHWFPLGPWRFVPGYNFIFMTADVRMSIISTVFKARLFMRPILYSSIASAFACVITS